MVVRATVGSVISKLCESLNNINGESMSNVKVNRRKFLKMLGWGGAGTALAGCDMPTTITLEEGKEEVVSYLMPEEYVIPGIGVWYASTCTQCEAGCGLHGRVREGRVLKLEGNPDSPINHGNTCLMGQSGVQAHYNPDRITTPMMRKGSTLQSVTWDEAMTELDKRIGANSGVKGGRVGMVTGTISGHQSVIVDELMSSLGSENHYVTEVVNTSVWSAVCRDMLGDELPKLNYDKAGVILSFGADFMATWTSPVHNMGEYAKFRKGEERGTLIQIEPKMTLTGANADLWIAAKPGTEGALALGIANFILDRGWNLVDVPSHVRKTLKIYNLEAVEKVTGVSADKIKRVAAILSERAPSLVIAGASTENHENGYDAVAAVMLLNLILGNVGETIEANSRFPEKSLRAKQGGTSDLLLLAKALKEKKLDVLFTYNTNPSYSAPDALQINKGLSDVGFKVAFSMFPDETTLRADLVLPIYSGMEDWGTHVAAYQPAEPILGLQQPLMEPLHKETRGFGDIILSLLKMRSKDFDNFADYYGYIQTAIVNMPSNVTGNVTGDQTDMWTNILQSGLINAKGEKAPLSPRLVEMRYKPQVEDSRYPMHLVPSARLGLWDGRHANIPWLQEAPDQISKVVWGSWAELHPKKALELGVKNGDYVRVSSASGSVEVQVYVHKGIHPDAVAVPIGQGHEDFGRYAKSRGVNPLKMLNPLMERRTGELATHATRVSVSKTHKTDVLVKMGGSEVQVGRRFVRTISADALRRTEGEA
ncbi:MAG TPA: molybdopterin dinucleotide-binding protein [Gammaproteobacteria bacterium]|nr:molybdopterin dinucleotide-binding protein [Gammaproteobacteria bacterium]